VGSTLPCAWAGAAGWRGLPATALPGCAMRDEGIPCLCLLCRRRSKVEIRLMSRSRWNGPETRLKGGHRHQTRHMSQKFMPSLCLNQTLQLVEQGDCVGLRVLQ